MEYLGKWYLGKFDFKRFYFSWYSYVLFYIGFNIVFYLSYYFKNIYYCI